MSKAITVTKGNFSSISRTYILSRYLTINQRIKSADLDKVICVNESYEKPFIQNTRHLFHGFIFDFLLDKSLGEWGKRLISSNLKKWKDLYVRLMTSSYKYIWSNFCVEKKGRCMKKSSSTEHLFGSSELLIFHCV